MKTPRYILLLFCGVCLVQLAIPLSTLLTREQTLRAGTAFKFRTVPLDPNDMFRGKYISLSFPPYLLPAPDSVSTKGPYKIFALLTTDSLGYATISAASLTRPASGTPYLHTEAQRLYYTRDSIKVLVPFNRYYMDESKAYQAEVLYGTMAGRDSFPAYALVRVLDGNYALEDVMIRDTSIRVWAARALKMGTDSTLNTLRSE
ncbi:MAG: GDYXXLXY domain-containing protein [Bacteroidia bacterium]|nr:GDYXXLXY domain-containing protein [Bacteroidia bacterium]